MDMSILKMQLMATVLCESIRIGIVALLIFSNRSMEAMRKG